MTDHPTIAEQIEAVERAVAYLDQKDREMREKFDLPVKVTNQVAVYRAALAAACETLRTLEFAREALN